LIEDLWVSKVSEPTTSKVLAHAFFAELRGKRDVDDVLGNAAFLMGCTRAHSCRRGVSHRWLALIERRPPASEPRL